MNEEHFTNSILIPPIYGYTKDGKSPYKPAPSEVFSEWLGSVNFFKNASSLPSAVYAVFSIGSISFALIYLIFFFSIKMFLAVLLLVWFLGTVYNTIWYHRYCAHCSFKFKRAIYAKIFLWTNPSIFREESYALPHRIHHLKSDSIGDPYGPHLGWLGSFFATESTQKINTGITEERFLSVKESLRHIGINFSTYDQFKKTGSFENIAFYFSRLLVAQFVWILLGVAIWGGQFTQYWIVSLGIYTFLLRDFNWRGHGGNFRKYKKKDWEYSLKDRALNQPFYGLIAGEWHDNHHNYPMSANNGFMPSQPDLAFAFIKIMFKLRIVESFFDAAAHFKTTYLVVDRDANS